MGYTETISCDTCGNLILPGDVIYVGTKGIFLGIEDSLDIQEVEESQPQHLCGSCSTALGETLRGMLAASQTVTDCSQGVCCNACGETDEDDPPMTLEEALDMTSNLGEEEDMDEPLLPGWDMTVSDYKAAAEAAGLKYHALDIGDDGSGICPFEDCVHSETIVNAAARLHA